MTLIKSLLLGSAAGIVAVATAQAADLPTRKAAPVEYVRVCNVGGITGWTLPGSDTCVKLSGYVTAQVVGGNLNTQYAWGTVGDAIDAISKYARARLDPYRPRLSYRGTGSYRPSQHPTRSARRQPRSAEYDLLPPRNWLVDPGEPVARRGLQHGLWPLDRAR